MSRIGKKPIDIPAGVSVEVDNSNRVEVKGPKGTLYEAVNPEISVEVEGNQIVLKRPTEQKRHKALHGLYRSLVANMIVGVNEGYKKTLELVGVGFKADIRPNNLLELNLGYSHNIYFSIPEEIKVSAETVKGKAPVVILESIDKQLIGHVAAKIKSLRKVEPYKGKGVRFQGEYIRRKAGKTASK